MSETTYRVEDPGTAAMRPGVNFEMVLLPRETAGPAVIVVRSMRRTESRPGDPGHSGPGVLIPT